MIKSGARAVFAVSLVMTGCAPAMMGDDGSAAEDASIASDARTSAVDVATSSDAAGESVAMDAAVEDAMPEHDGAARDAAVPSSDGAAEAASDARETAADSADWIIGTWQRAGQAELLRTDVNDVLSVRIEADGARRFSFQRHNSTSRTEGTWRALSGGRVELRSIAGSVETLDGGSVLASCNLVRYSGVVLRRFSGAPSGSCPFVRPAISDRECSLEGREFTWDRPGVGIGERFTISLLADRVGYYSQTFQQLIDCWDICTYRSMQRPLQYFEWSIDGDRLQLGGLSVPETASTSIRRVGACRASAFYTAPTNLHGERCGDGLCRGFETSVDCPADCGYAPDQRCPVGARCSSEAGARTCASNSAGSAEGTCRRRCSPGNSECASACCGAYTEGESLVCFAASDCNDSAPTCREMDQRCTETWECCAVGGRASICVSGLDPENPAAAACRPSCFVDADCGREAYCSCRLTDGRRTCSRSRTGC
jgi:hypothetical protein